jgi:hypothetical protein
VTWVSFFAARDDLVELIRFVYAETDCRVFEAYSLPDHTQPTAKLVVDPA